MAKDRGNRTRFEKNNNRTKVYKYFITLVMQKCYLSNKSDIQNKNTTTSSNE